MSKMRSREYWKSFVEELSAEEQERLLDILIEQRLLAGWSNFQLWQRRSERCRSDQ